MKAGYAALTFFSVIFGFFYFPLMAIAYYFLCFFFAGFHTLKRLYKRSDCSITLKILLTIPAFLLFLVVYCCWGVVFASLLLFIPLLSFPFAFVVVWREGCMGFMKLLILGMIGSRAYHVGLIDIMHRLGHLLSPFCCI